MYTSLDENTWYLNQHEHQQLVAEHNNVLRLIDVKDEVIELAIQILLNGEQELFNEAFDEFYNPVEDQYDSYFITILHDWYEGRDFALEDYDFLLYLVKKALNTASEVIEGVDFNTLANEGHWCVGNIYSEVIGGV